MICSSQYWSLPHRQESLLKQTKWDRNTAGTKAKGHTPSNQSFQRVHVQGEVAPQESWCSQGTLKLPGTIASYWHLGISSSNMLPGYFSTSKKANYNVVLLVSGIYSLLLYRLLFFPFWALQTKSHRTRNEGKFELKVAVLPTFTYIESSAAAFLANMGDSRMKWCLSLFMSIKERLWMQLITQLAPHI